MRQCGECSLCCKLLPVRSLGKLAGHRCKHQRHTGCMVYHKPNITIDNGSIVQIDGPKSSMPPECQLWNCRWLVNEAGATFRPDRTHYVIDVMPDFITAQDNVLSETHNVEVIQIWVDPKHPDSWRDPDLLAYLRLRGEEGKAALIRYNARDAFVLLPPAMAGDDDFHELRDGKSSERTHTVTEIIKALGAIGAEATMEDGRG